MRVLLAMLLLTASLPLLAPQAEACHPYVDPGTPVWAWVDHGCGGQPSLYACWRLVVVGDCTTLLP